MPDEVKFLTDLIFPGGVFPPGGHPGEPDAIVDDVEQIAIRERLGFRLPLSGALG